MPVREVWQTDAEGYQSAVLSVNPAGSWSRAEDAPFDVDVRTWFKVEKDDVIVAILKDREQAFLVDMRLSGEYRVGSTGLVHSPGFYNWAMAVHRGLFDEPTETIAVRLFTLATAFPDLPAGVLRAMAEKQAEVVTEGKTLVIRVKE